MSDTDAASADMDAEWRLQQARAMLILFEADCGRAPLTLEEIREWASTQDQGHLAFRVTHQVHCDP